jgi:hypothetical protein
VVKALASGASHASGVGSSPTLFTILFAGPKRWRWGYNVQVFLDEDGKVTWRLFGSTLVHARVERSLRWTDWDHWSDSGGGVDGGLSSGWLLYLSESFCLLASGTY